MNERKNIDRLFQEKLKDFEVSPPETAWAAIESKLDEKKKRRLIPFWWKLSGVAAILFLSFLISRSFSDGGIKNENAVVNDSNLGTIEKVNRPAGFISNRGQKNSIVTKSGNSVVKGSNFGKSNIKKGKASNGSAASNAIATVSVKSNNNGSEGKSLRKKDLLSLKKAITEGKKVNPHSSKNKLNRNKPYLTVSFLKNSSDQVAKGEKEAAKELNQLLKNNPSSIAEKELIKTNIKETNDLDALEAPNKANINPDDLKGTITSKIATKEIEKKVNDTAKKNGVATNVLEELLNEKESKKKGSKGNRWQLTTNVAPIFLGSVSKGSPIDSTLSKNSKSYKTNLTYGIGVSYAVNRKFSIRTGLSRVNMSYNTNDIIFFTGIQSKMLQNVTPIASSVMIQVQSTAANTVNATSETGLLPFESSFVNKNPGYLRQDMGYLEMPFEMTYTMLDKKFGVKVIGGFSTLFLEDNSITIISEGRSLDLGKADNLNNVHFSTNLGIGMKYSFMKSFEFNVEPTVKYQMNTFSSNSGNFKPYLFGVYSGISYKF